MKTHRTRYLQTQTPVVGPIRELTRGDLSVLAIKRQPVHIQTIRDSHHRIARAIASGMRNDEIAATCGISITRVSMLKADPSMQDLIAHYRALITDDWVQTVDPVKDFLKEVTTKSIAMIADKLDTAIEKNETLPSRDLVAFAELGLDRTGYGKERRNFNTNLNFASELERMRKRTSRVNDMRTIEARPSTGPLPPSPGQTLAVTSGPPASRLFRRI